MVLNAEKSRYGKLVEELFNDILKRNDNYLTTTTKSYELLLNFKHENRNYGQMLDLDLISFVTKGDDDENNCEPRRQKRGTRAS